MKLKPNTARIFKNKAGESRVKNLFKRKHSILKGDKLVKKIKKRHKHIGLKVLLVVAIIFGGIYYFRSSILKQFIPSFKLVGDINIKVLNDTSYVSFKIGLANETFLKIKLDTLRYSISLSDKVYMQNSECIGLTLTRNSVDTVDLTLKIPYSTMLADLKEERKNTNNINCDIHLFLGYETFFEKSRMTLVTAVEFELIQPPELKIQSIQYTKLGLNTILADASIKIVNHSRLNLMVKEMSYYMNIYQMGNLSGYYGSPISIGPHETTFVTLPITIDVDNLGKTLFAILIDKDNYYFTLNLQAAMESVNPIKRSFNLSITKSGQMELKKSKTSSERQEKRDKRKRMRQLNRENC